MVQRERERPTRRNEAVTVKVSPKTVEAGMKRRSGSIPQRLSVVARRLARTTSVRCCDPLHPA
jgi:hypothetical protein